MFDFYQEEKAEVFKKSHFLNLKVGLFVSFWHSEKSMRLIQVCFSLLPKTDLRVGMGVFFNNGGHGLALCGTRLH